MAMNLPMTEAQLDGHVLGLVQQFVNKGTETANSSLVNALKRHIERIAKHDLKKWWQNTVTDDTFKTTVKEIVADVMLPTISDLEKTKAATASLESTMEKVLGAALKKAVSDVIAGALRKSRAGNFVAIELEKREKKLEKKLRAEMRDEYKAELEKVVGPLREQIESQGPIIQHLHTTTDSIPHQNNNNVDLEEDAMDMEEGIFAVDDDDDEDPEMD